MASMSVEVLIPNYNGCNLLKSHLPGLRNELSMLRIIVVDDGSSDDSVEYLHSMLPGKDVIVRAKNGGFSAATNDGFGACQADLVLLLNNDVDVTAGFLPPLVSQFDDPNVFAVSPSITLTHRDGLDEAAKTGFWRHGMFYVDQRACVDEISPILYGTGCAVLYRRSMLMELGGFDEAYSPFYWEDADLGYRAWKRGWKTLYHPGSAVYHRHSASISRMKRGFTDRVKARNSLFFVWRNFEDAKELKMHRRWLPLVLAKRAFSGDWPYLLGWKDAFARRSDALCARSQDSKNRVLSDEAIWAATKVRFE
ncbi:MAG: glycosyltransferase family 2 protein [Armatimonadota bacterium]